MYNNRFNHNPFVYGVWVEFNGWRTKNPHMVRTKDGREFIGVPNGGAWLDPDNKWVEDSDVSHIKVLSDGEMAGYHRGMAGGMRLARDIDYFGTHYPIYCGEDRGFVWPGELEPNESILPVAVIAHRNKEANIRNKTKLIITKGIITDSNGDHGIGEVQSLIKHLGFWISSETNVMSHQEVIRGIHEVAKCEKLMNVNPELYAEFYQYLVSKEIPLEQRMYNFAALAMKFDNDRETFNRQFDQLREISKERQSNKLFIITNALRGPVSPQVYSTDMLALSNFFKNPLVLPDHYLPIESL